MKGRRSRTSKRAGPPDTVVDHDRGSETESGAISSETLFELLGDSYARRILTLLVERPRTGMELTTATDMSRPTVYRRLERLRETGLVRTEMQLDPDGHHRNRFYATVSEFDFEVGSTGIESRVCSPDEGRTELERGPHSRRFDE